MFEIKVTHNDGLVRIVRFKEIIRSNVMHKYNQLVSQGDILDFELVQCQWYRLDLEKEKKGKLMEYPLSYGKVYADCSYCEKVFIVDSYTESFCNYCRSTLVKQVA